MQINNYTNPFNPNQTDKPIGVAESIYKSFSKGEITWDLTEKHMAMHISKTLHDHVPFKYPERSQTLVDYVSGRINLQTERSHVLAIKNGEWIQLVNRVNSKNISNYDLLIWAGRICKKMESESNCKLIREAVMQHIRAHDNFHWDGLNDALIVQRMDSDERSRTDSRNKN